MAGFSSVETFSSVATGLLLRSSEMSTPDSLRGYIHGLSVKKRRRSTDEGSRCRKRAGRSRGILIGEARGLRGERLDSAIGVLQTSAFFLKRSNVPVTLSHGD